MDFEAELAANLANWGERVAGHIADDGYASYRLLVEQPDYITDVVAFDAARLGPVSGKTLLHAQCHIGTDTLSWANLGASVTGLDFAPEAIAAAQTLARRMGVDAHFVETSVDDAPNHIDRDFDVVYTSVGAICWLPDIVRWAEVMASFVRPGGTFFIRDTHPLLLACEEGRDDELLVVGNPYFGDGRALDYGPDDGSYEGSATLVNAQTYEWAHPVSEVMNAVINAGLVIESFEEHRHLDWEYLPWMERRGERYVLPGGRAQHLPLQFSIKATKPAV